MKTKIFISFLLFAVCCVGTVKAQEITSFDGMWSVEYYEDDKRITVKELKALFEKNQEVKAYWKKVETNYIIGYSSILAELGFALWTAERLANDKNSVGPAIGTLGFAALGVIFLSIGNKNKKKAILKYNKQFDSPGDGTSFRLEPIGNDNGVGLALKF